MWMRTRTQAQIVMVELVLAKDVLKEILFENKSFKRSIKDKFSREKQLTNTRKIVSSLVGCELRHHLLLKKVIKKSRVELNLDERSYLLLALANHYFYKGLSEKGVNKDLLDVFGEKYQQIRPLFSVDGELINYLEIGKNTIDYLSIRYNTPKQIVISFTRDLGISRTQRCLRAMSHACDFTYRLNPYCEQAREYIKRNEDLLGIEAAPDVVYIDKKVLREHSELAEPTVFEIDPNLKTLVDKYHNDLIDEVTVYSGEDDSLIFELLSRKNKNLGINAATPNYEERLRLLKFIRTIKNKNINIFNGHDFASLRSGISRPTELVYCYPKSTSFSKMNHSPDYLIHYDEKHVSELVKTQKEAIKNCSKFVCENGYLIYIVDTMNVDESTKIVRSFLKDNPNFSLIEQRQYIASIHHPYLLYYAVLKLEDQNG